jgi:FtsX extracellular domain
MRRLALAVAALAMVVAGCGGSSSGPAPQILHRTKPDLAAFLRLPVATPSACPSSANGTTIGRRSPWVGTVDVSVFLSPTATARQVRSAGQRLRTDPLVKTVYFESAAQAYREFQRLYTCWTAVPRSETPPSYRLVLRSRATLSERNLLVRRIAGEPEIDTVSCDPTVPCTDTLASATASPSDSAG